MAIQQMTSGSSSGITSFLFQDDGSTDGTVLEGAEFAKALHQLLGEYEESGDTETAAPAESSELAANDATQELTAQTPLSTALDTLAADFALPAQSAALPDESTWEGAAEGQEIEQPFWGIAPFTDVMGALQQHTALADNLVDATATASTEATLANPAATEAAAAAPATPAFSTGIEHVISLARDAAQVSTQLTQASTLPARTGRNAPASGKVLPQGFRMAPNTLRQPVSAQQSRANQAAAMTEAFATAMGTDTGFAMPEALTGDARGQQAAATQAPAPTQGIQALRTETALPSQGKAVEAAATNANLHLQSQHIAGTDAWFEDLGTRVEWLKDMNVQKAELQLHPAELGLLEIQISTGDDGTSVSFITHNAAARELIEESMPRLRDLLASQGMQLGQSQVSQHDGQRRGQDSPGAFAGQRDNATAEEAAPIRRTAYLADPSRIDHYV